MTGLSSEGSKKPFHIGRLLRGLPLTNGGARQLGAARRVKGLFVLTRVVDTFLFTSRFKEAKLVMDALIADDDSNPGSSGGGASGGGGDDRKKGNGPLPPSKRPKCSPEGEGES